MIFCRIRAILLNVAIFSSMSCLAENSTFSGFLENADSIDLLPVQERNVTFLHGSLLQSENKESEVQSIYTVFLQLDGPAITLAKKDIVSLSKLPDHTYNASNDPLTGWLGSVILRAIRNGKEPSYWRITVMRSGFLSISPIQELYEPKSEGRSGLFQAAIYSSKEVGFCSKDAFWVRRITEFLKNKDAEQGAAANP